MKNIQDELKKSIATGESKHNQLEKKLKHPHEKAALGFFKNILSNSKAVILLAQNNHSKEAAAIDRLAIEHLLNLAALIKNPEHLDDLEAQSKSDIKRTLAKIVDNQKKHPSLEEELLLKAQAHLESAASTKELKANFYNIAEPSGLQDAIYDSSYRKLSATYAHSTLATILSSPNEDEILEDMQSYIALGIAFLETAESASK